MAIKMHDKRARRGIAKLGTELMPDAATLIQRHFVVTAPFAGLDVQQFLGGRRHRHQVVDEDRITLGLGDLLDAEILLHLAEDHIGVAREIIHNDEVRLGHHLVASAHARTARDPGKHLLGKGVPHANLPSGLSSAVFVFLLSA